MADALALLALLIGLELVLGVDNVLVIAIFVARLPPSRRKKARILGLTLAMFARLAMLAVVLVLAGLLLRRIPGRVEISGGQVQVVLPTAEGTAVTDVPATSTKTVEAKATSTST